MKRRLANLPLHGGKAPPWLFRRMTRLAGAVTMAVVDQFGPQEMLRRLADPWWFQAFGCVLGFDWHSSGVTTVTCGALKEAYKSCGADLGIVVAGGKGATSRQAPDEIAAAADRFAVSAGDRLVYASRMSAKVDSAAVQDGFQLYHHTFLFSPAGQWCVIQQGMNAQAKTARRYHWLGETVDDFVCEPHGAISDLASPARRSSIRSGRQLTLLNMVAGEAAENRDKSAALVRENPDWLIAQIERSTEGPTLFAPKHHRLLPKDVNTRHLRRILVSAHERHPDSFEALLGTRGVGPATILSLSLLAEVIFDAPASHRDPAERFRVAAEPAADEPGPPSSSWADRHLAEPTRPDRHLADPSRPDRHLADPSRPDRHLADPSRPDRHWADYAYAHGGKDGTPFPVDRATYDRNIALLIDAVRQARVGENDKMNALRRLSGRGC